MNPVHLCLNVVASMVAVTRSSLPLLFAARVFLFCVFLRFCSTCSFLLFPSSFVRVRLVTPIRPHERIAGWTTRITSNGRADTEHVATIRACVFLSFRRSRGNVHGNSIGVPLLGRSASPYSRLGCQSSLPKPLSVRAAVLHCRAQLQTRGSESCTRIACF